MESRAPLPRRRIPLLWNKLSGIVLHERLNLFFFISRIIYIIKNSWVLFIPWVILQYYFIYFVSQKFQLWPFHLCQLALASLWPTPTREGGAGFVFVSEPLLTLWHLKILQPPLVYVPFQSWKQTFLQRALLCWGFFNWRMVLETRIWVMCSLLLGYNC